MNRCEDYPCCGHTDGLGCNWTYTPEAQASDSLHAMCEHEHGICDVWDEEEEEPDVDDDFPMSMEYPMEDQWLDGSYEQ